MPEVISDVGRIYLRWALTDGVGPLTFSRLIVQFGDPATAMGASAGALSEIPRVGRAQADAMARGPDPEVIEREIEVAAKHGVRIISRVDPDYPEGLRNIPDAPIVLYVKGELRPTDAIAVAIVGSRRCTIYGSEQARRFGELLAGAGVTVVSGLARGIDAFAHHGAVDAGGRSIAVMGAGLTEVYPPENRALADRLLEHGAWISELPMTSVVRASNFPSRNRIIAGMTLGTLVVEAAARSGALITARLASEYNREVFAIPGRVQDPMSIGTNALIRDGSAKLVTCLEDVLDELGDVGRSLRRGEPAGIGEKQPNAAGPSHDARKKQDLAAGPGLSAAERRVYEVVTYDALLTDAIITASGLPPGEVLAALTALELKGLVRRLPGNLVVRRGVA